MTHTPADTLLIELRSSTRALHEDIERLLALESPMELVRYRAIIGGFHDFLGRWEQDVANALPSPLRAWFAERNRTHFAAADLAYLESQGLPALAKAPPLPPVLPELPSGCVASAIGSMYVIEGSALGGQVITPRLERDLGLAPGRGASYFHGFGSHTGAMWREFRLKAVAEVGAEPAAQRAACMAAEATFSALIETFRPRVA